VLPQTKDCCYYFTVEPLQSEYKDEGDSPLLEIPVETPRGSVTVALLGKKNRIDAIRVRVPDCPGEQLTDWHLRMIQTLKEHTLSVLRVCYEADIQLTPYAFWAYCNPGAPPGVGLEANLVVNPNYVLNADNIKNVFNQSYPAKEALRLLSDGVNPRNPIQFRYLALYLLFEREFKTGNKWDKHFHQLVSRFEPQWRQLALSDRPLRTHIHVLRDRCAHVRGRGKHIGVNMLSQKDALELAKVLPLMLELARSTINERHSAKGFSIEAGPPTGSAP